VAGLETVDATGVAFGDADVTAVAVGVDVGEVIATDTAGLPCPTWYANAATAPITAIVRQTSRTGERAQAGLFMSEIKLISKLLLGNQFAGH
jgi:hypothetical protein